MNNINFSPNPNISELRKETLEDYPSLHTIKEIKKWFMERRNSPHLKIEVIPLKDCKNWNISPDNITHSSGDFFKVEGVRVTQSKSREVGSKGWDQPILTQIGFDGGIVGLIRTIEFGTPHYLVNLKEEPGNYKIAQLSPTLQATFANLNQAHGGSKPKYSEHFIKYKESKSGDDLIFRSWFSEDGGRLLNKRNLGVIINKNISLSKEEQSEYKWITLWQIKTLINENAWINPHLRSLVSYI